MFPIGTFSEPGGSLGIEADGGSRPPLCFHANNRIISSFSVICFATCRAEMLSPDGVTKARKTALEHLRQRCHGSDLHRWREVFRLVNRARREPPDGGHGLLYPAWWKKNPPQKMQIQRATR